MKTIKIFLPIVITAAVITGCVKNLPDEKIIKTDKIEKIEIKGKVTWRTKENVLKDAYVYVYKDNSTDFKDLPFIISAPTNEKGDFSLTLPPGTYYFVTRKFNNNPPPSAGFEMEVGEYYCYYAGNPVPVYQKEPILIGFNCGKITKKESTENSFEENKKSGIKGVITHDGKPVSGAYVLVFKNSKSDFRGPTFTMSSPSNLNGQFRIELAPGKYYLTMRKKKNIDTGRFFNVFQEGNEVAGNIAAGPLAKGDYACYYYNNPITVTEGHYADIELSAAAKISEDEIITSNLKTPTRIEGTIKDKDKNPVEGVRVFAFRRRMMGAEKPAFISNITKKDGKYAINFTEGGLFYLVARDFVGRPPKCGDICGYYFGTEDHSIVIKKDTVLKNTDLKTWKIE